MWSKVQSTTQRGWSKYYPKRVVQVQVLPKEVVEPPKEVVQVLPKEGGPSTTQRVVVQVGQVLPKEGGPSTTQRGWSKYYPKGVLVLQKYYPKRVVQRSTSTTQRGWSKYYPKRVVQVLPKEGPKDCGSKYYPKRVVLVLPKEGGPSTTQRGWSKY